MFLLSLWLVAEVFGREAGDYCAFDQQPDFYNPHVPNCAALPSMSSALASCRASHSALKYPRRCQDLVFSHAIGALSTCTDSASASATSEQTTAVFMGIREILEAPEAPRRTEVVTVTQYQPVVAE